MKATPDLFNLVKSLNKYEKRYVTLFLSSGLYKNNRGSLTLFRAISRQEHFDDAGLRKKMGKVFSKRLSAEKNKLFDLILESMMFLYRDAMAERMVVRNRLRSWFLFQKGLRPLAWKYFQKARELAEENELLPHLAQLAYMENFEVRVAPPAGSQFSGELLHTRDKKILNKLNTDLVLHTLYSEITELYKRFGNEGKLAGADLEKIMDHPFVDPRYELSAFTSVISRLEIRGLGYAMKNNHDEAYECFRLEVEAIEQTEKRKRANFGRYCHALINQLMHLVLKREYEELPSLLQKIRKTNTDMQDYFSWDPGYNEFVGVQFLELISWRNRADLVTGPLLLAKVEKGLTKYRSKLDDSFTVGVLYLLGNYHFYLGNLKKSLHYINDLIDSVHVETGVHFHCMARLVKLLLHYELGHYDLLSSLAQSTIRLLKKNEQLGPFEKELTGFFRKSAGKQDKSATGALLAVARKHAPGYYSYGAWCDFEFEAWIESQLTGNSFAKTISEKQVKS